MNAIALSSRARTRTLLALAGIATATGTLATAGSAGAVGPNTSGSDLPRATSSADATCAADGTPTSFTVSYDDHVDGHVPQSIHEELLDDGGLVWSADELHQVNGDYFNAHTFSAANPPFDPNGNYLYRVTITYDDGVTQESGSGFSPVDWCDSPPPTTASPQPEPDRFQLLEGLYGCGTSNGGAFLEWSYGDYADGHYAQSFSLDLLKDGALVEHHTTSGGDPSSDGASTAFDVRPDGNPGAAFDPFFDDVTLTPASYSLSITVNYEDGATDKHVETLNLGSLCNGVVNGRTAAPPSTTAPAITVPAGSPTTTTTLPTGTLPETGASESTWIIGSIAGLLMTAGAVLVAGARRSRIG